MALCTNEEFSAAVNVLETRLTLSKSAFPFIIRANNLFRSYFFFLITCTVFHSLPKQVRKLIGAIRHPTLKIRHPTSNIRRVKIRQPTCKNPTSDLLKSDIRLVKIRHPTCRNPTSDLYKSDIRLVKIRHPTC